MMTASTECLHLIAIYCILAFSKQKKQKAGERSIKKGEKKNLKSGLACRVQSSLKYLQMFSFLLFFFLIK